MPNDAPDLDGDGDRRERTPIDRTGGPRFVDDPCTVDTGVADPPDYPMIVDMGAHEYRLGDYDGDGVVGLGDFGTLITCLAGPGINPGVAGFEFFDFDCDQDVDLADFAAFQQAFTG